MRTTIGILGGGQLARMSALAAYNLGFRIAILEKTKYSPAGSIAHANFVGWVNETRVLKKFADSAGIVTLENEFVDFNYLEEIEAWGKPVIPSSYTISIIQDKFLQKSALQKKQIPVPDFLPVDKTSHYNLLSAALGKRFILKSRKMGYDGYGNAEINSEKDFEKNFTRLTERHSELMAERFVQFSSELAVMVVRTKKQVHTYPVVETIQKNHICNIVIAPARISSKLKREVEEIAIESVKAVNGFGLFGIELFLTEDNKILVNEMAPRPHNSGHYTINACVTSQFENHIRSVMNLPLGSTAMLKPAAVMVNLLGKKNGNKKPFDYKKALSDDEIKLHLYDKEESRIGRKMGHITLLGDEIEEVLARATGLESKIKI